MLENIVSKSLVFYNCIICEAKVHNTKLNRRGALDPTLVFSCRVVSSCGYLSDGRTARKRSTTIVFKTRI
jgi:hypothetical protein